MVKRVRVQRLDDYKRDVDGSVIVRSRLVAMQVAWEPRTDCFAGTCKTDVELRTHTVQRPEKQIVWFPRLVVAFYHALLDEGRSSEREGRRAWSRVAVKESTLRKSASRAAVPAKNT